MAESVEKKSVYLFAGEDSFSAFEKSQLWKHRFLEKYGDLNCLSYYGEDLTASEFQTAIESYPFLSEKKLLMVQDFLAEGSTDDQKAVADLIDGVPDYCVVVFFEHKKPDARNALYKKLVKVGQVENYEMKSGVMLNRWIVERAAKKSLRLENRDAELMAELVGPNLWNMANEIDKLAIYLNGAPVTQKIIEDVVSINLASSIFKLTDYLGEKRLKESIRTLEILVNSGEEIIGMIFMLVRHFRIMAQVKDLAEKGERAPDIAKKIKEHPFVVSKIFAQCRGFSDRQIREIYQMLLDVDSGFKTGRIKISTNDHSELVRELEVMVGKICL